MFKPKTLNRISELDVDAEIVGIKLEPVVGGQTAILLDVHRQRRNSTIDVELPVPIPIRRCFEGDPRAWRDCGVHHAKRTCALGELSKDRLPVASRQSPVSSPSGTETGNWNTHASIRPRCPTRTRPLMPRSGSTMGCRTSPADFESARATTRSRPAQPRATPSSPPPAERESRFAWDSTQDS